jgi:hypothetical protein
MKICPKILWVAARFASRAGLALLATAFLQLDVATAADSASKSVLLVCKRCKSSSPFAAQSIRVVPCYAGTGHGFDR